MTLPVLNRFIADAEDCASRHADPAECVTAIAPLMHELLKRADTFLEARHFRSDPGHYARNAIHVAPDHSLSLYALVWTPGQWTPVHDHGSWGVVGVLKGVLEERSYVRMDADRGADEGIRLHRGGVVLLGPGAVTSFVPNPDHIHVTGVEAGREQVVSLHLYGRNMDSFHIYDAPAGTRKRVQVPYNES
jgi:predicted metal-dependent enzyme (double-stranded beta helix superfamily)